MPINSAIPLSAQPYKAPSMLDSYGKAVTLKNLINQQQLQGLQMQKAQMELQNYDPRAQKQLQQQQLDLGQLNLDKTKLEMAIKRSNRVAQLLGNSTDPVSYQYNRNIALQEFPDLQGKIPDQYDPNWVNGMMQQTLSVKDRLDYAYKNQTLAETKRHNLKSEDLSGQKIQNKKEESQLLVPELGASDPESGSILAQTGLSMPAFLAITGDAQKLPRDKATRNIAFKQAEEFANSHGIDVSTISSQYQAYNKTLQSNIMRNNQTNILEQEISGTIDVLKPIADAAGLGNIKIANIAKIFAGKETNDPVIQQYRQQILLLQSELAGMNAAARGNIDQTGNVKTDNSDMKDAEMIIMSGLNAGGAEGLRKAIENTVSKNRMVLEHNIDASRKAIWGLFGVGKNYKSQSPENSPDAPEALPANEDDALIQKYLK